MELTIEPMKEYMVAVNCPWCQKSVMLADRPAEIEVSCQCAKCRQIYRVDFKDGSTIRGSPNRRIKIK